jgi:Tol biopolymer transport system component
MTLAAGRRLGAYEIVSPLGAGGMGEVYRARDTRLDRTVAIKVLAAPLAGDAQLRERFEREARAISALDHPNICALYDVGEQDGIAYLVMQHLEGESLADRLARGPLPADQALRHAAEIADALSRAHRQGIVHRDLKPGNVMLTKTGAARQGSPQAKLLDFGLAKMTQTAPGGAQQTMLPTTPANLTAAGTILGTFQYMAPEQLEGGEADARTDIFAFGAMLYEMLTGRRAFEAKSQASLISAIMSFEPPPVSSQAQVPPALDYVVARCLAKDPDDRWQTARDLLAELKRASGLGTASTVAVSSVSVMEAAGPAATAAAGRPRWQKLVWAASTLAAFAVLVTAVVVVVSRREPPVAAPVHLAMLVEPAESLGGTFAFSPDGTQVAFAGMAESVRHLYVRPLAKQTATLVPGTEGVSVDGAAYSPDGKTLAFTARRTLKLVPLDGGPAASLGGARQDRPAWAPNQSIIFNAAAHSGLSRVPAGGGTPTPLTKLDDKNGELSHRWPVVLPGGLAFLYHATTSTDGDADPLVIAQRFDTGERKTLFRGSFTSVLPSGELLFVRGTTLMTVGFDPATLTVTGDAAAVVDNVLFAQSSPDGTTLAAYQTSGPRAAGQMESRGSLVTVNRAGATQRLDVPDRMFSDPRVSPDGTRVVSHVFEAGFDIWVSDVKRGTLMRLTFDAGEDETPIWSPDGRWVIFTATREGQRGVYRKAADGSGAEELLWRGSGHIHVGGITADGNTLLVSRNDGGEMDVMSITVKDGTIKPVLASPSREYSPSLSRDGRWLAYASDESGRPEIYVRSFPSLEGRWQVSTGGGIEPVWARDGKTLFYRGSGKIMAVDVAAGSALMPSAPRPLFDDRFASMQGDTHTCYDTMPDGSLLMVQESGERRVIRHVNVILNWLARPEGRR